MASSATLQNSQKIFSLRGIFPAITTPFNSKQEVFYEKLRENLQHYEKIPFSGYMVNGSNGEVAALTTEERVQILRNVQQSVNPKRILIANAYCESTHQCCELAKDLARNGADAVLVLVPFYHRRSLTAEAIIAHFTAVADESPVPVILYNNTGVSSVDLSVKTILKLAEHPNIRGVKDVDVAKITELVSVVKQRGLEFEVTQGSTAYLLQSLVVGASGGVVALPNVLGQQVCQLYQHYRESRMEEAAQLQTRLTRIDRLLMLANLGVPGMKATLELVGLYGGPCRLPLQSLPSEDVATIKQVLQEDGFLNIA